MNNLVEKYKPYLYFHPLEKFFPISANNYISNSRLTRPPNNQMVLDIGEVDEKSLLTYDDNTYNLTLSPNMYNGMDLSGVPYYCHILDNPDHSFIDLQYIFLYGYNDSYKVCSCDYVNLCPCIKVGEHIYDLEHITVRISKNTQKLLKVHFGAHQRKDGMWVNNSNLEMEDDTHPVVYVAKGSHALYPSTWCWPRIFCVANDYTCKGKLWVPRNVLIINDAIWNLWKGNYDGEDTPYRHDWYKSEYEGSTNYMKRLCCPCMDENNKIEKCQ